MITKEKPATSAATLGRAKVERAAALAGSASNSVTQSNTPQGTISSVLLQGRENAITGAEIRRILALKDGRDVTVIVERERRGGVPICATCDSNKPGYYMPETPGELETYCRSLRRRIAHVAQTLDAMEKALDDWTGQQRLDLPGGDAG